MKKTLILLGMLTIAVSAAQLDEMQERESRSHQERIGMLTEADRCIKTATTKEAYKKCEEIEQGQRESFKKENFAEKKAEISKKMAERIREMQAVKACVDGANSREEMKACRPAKRDRQTH